MTAVQLVAAVAVVAMVGAGSVCAQVPSDLPPVSYQHRVVLDQDSPFVMLWTPGDDAIDIEVQVGAKGYVGLGFSPNGGMKGADIVLGWVDTAGKVFLHDRYAEGNMAPKVDVSQDVKLLGGYQNNTHTVLRFSRPWNTCDESQDFVLTDDTVRVIWAYSNSDPASETDLNYHAARGTKSLYLKSPQFVMPELGPDVKTWDFLSPNLSLPDNLDTLYWCKIFKKPPTPVKSHMIGFVPVIEEENAEHVHHILFYECYVPDSDTHFEKWVSLEGMQCYNANMPTSWKYCKSVVVSWAVGGEGKMFPELAGFPIGEEHGGATYYMMEMHYDNPNLRQGVVDSSGIRIFYTENLRDYDAGMFMLGHKVSAFHLIPPGQPRFMTGSFCDSSCTQQELPEEGVKIFQGMLHSHLMGTSMVLRHIRDGQELPVIMKDMHYDFNYQTTRVLQEEVTVLPGDTLITECYYDSSNRSNPTFGGLDTREEMCLAIMSYYPRVKLHMCQSQPDMKSVITALGVQELYTEERIFQMLNQQFLETQPIDEESERVRAEKLQNGELSQELRPVQFSNMYKLMRIAAPDEYLNMSVFSLLHDEATWQNTTVIDALQSLPTTSHYTTGCNTHTENKSIKDYKLVPYPSFTPRAPEVDQCPRPMTAVQLVVAVAVAAMVGAGSVCAQVPSDLPPMSYQYRVVLDQDSPFVMLWTPGDDAIDIEVQVGAKGYVALGFSPNGGMKGADIVLGWVDTAGKVFLHDRYAEGNMAPKVDVSQDVKLLGGYQNDTHTVLRFSRPWNTCDESQDFVLTDDTVRVIWAYSNSDPARETDLNYHAARGTKSLYLKSSQFVMPELGPDVKTWDFLSPNLSLPDNLDTLYWCKIFKKPPTPVKSHMIGFVPVIEEENAEHVHHILFYECYVPDSDTHFEKWVSWEGTQCYSANMPNSWKYCKSVVVAWAVGGEGRMFPEYTGFPIGEEHGGATYYMMEMHYNNPNLRQGVVDSSGIRIFYTENLRDYDAGMFMLGHKVSAFHLIPPGQPRFMTGSFCDSSCTQQELPEKGVKVFEGILHSHLMGTSMVLRHIRDGQELPVIMKDMHYDFKYQSSRVLQEEVTVLPGDALIIECYYDSSNRSNPTFGGLGTREEMCQVALSYYPRVKLHMCQSQPDMKSVITALGVQELYTEERM
ncbi:uncharacterized protein LOC126997815 [Eriocheir sinensis]|uniref:uncharacterized protein LOC126997815 n=1 Tax=Eriocheir sinensis TaxID=95602 RepID=UPI0021C7AF0F|nr:uncharacterized protein LOC126997815 [Eriocheir sinensis]